MELLVDPSWKKTVKTERAKTYFQQLFAFLDTEYQHCAGQIFPAPARILRALKECALDDIKVVIIGQDPYPTFGHADGLCFSVEEDVFPLPKSLQAIYKELASDLGKAMPSNGSLLPWAKQGVLLLNTILTVREGAAGSHSKKGWEKFTDVIIETIGQKREGVVFLLWGAKAQEKSTLIDTSKNLILSAPHPSPLSSYRGFFGCKHFSKANTYLVQQGKIPIEW